MEQTSDAAHLTVAEILDEALHLISTNGHVKYTHVDVESGGYDLSGAVNVANHGKADYTESVNRRSALSQQQRVRVGQAFRILLDVIYDPVNHSDLPLGEVKRRLEEWNDEFIRQKFEVEAILRRAIKLARYRQDIGQIQ